MKITSVNVGSEESLSVGERTVMTGIHKRPTSNRVRVTKNGLEQDQIINTKYHGGSDQAVYVYFTDDYDAWASDSKYAFTPGAFGENLTMTGCQSSDLNIGDRLRIGKDIVLEISAARIPCDILAAHVGDLGFVKTFRKFKRPGAYCRVIQTGLVGTNDAVRLEKFTGATFRLVEDFELYYDAQASINQIQRALLAPISIRTRQRLTEKLEKQKP